MTDYRQNTTEDILKAFNPNTVDWQCSNLNQLKEAKSLLEDHFNIKNTATKQNKRFSFFGLLPNKEKQSNKKSKEPKFKLTTDII